MSTAQIAAPVCSELRQALNYLHDISREEREWEQRWGKDRHDAWYYFELESRPLLKWRGKVSEFLHELKKQGEYATYVDVCGRAQATSLGADENYSFSLQPINPYDRLRTAPDSNASDPRFVGDIFNARDFNSFLSLLRQQQSRPAFVTFEPVAGLQAYVPFETRVTKGKEPVQYRDVAHQILKRNLRKIIQILRPGGYFLLGPPFSLSDLSGFLQRKPQNMYESSLEVKRLARKLKCTVEIAPTCYNGPRWLLRKKEEKT